MRRLYGLVAVLAASVSLALPTFAAEKDLDVTMEIIDDMSDIDGDFIGSMAPVRATDGRTEEPDAVADNDGEREVIEQLIEMNVDFDAVDENDGFEHDDAAARDYAAFIDEDNFEEGEDVDDDRYDEVDDPTT